jgi:hypothetical protein
MTFLVMPPSITETHKIFRGRATWLHSKTGWFTEREEKIGVNRILRDDPSKGDMNNRQHVDPRGIWQAVKDIDLWPTYVVSLCTLCLLDLYLTWVSLASWLSSLSSLPPIICL